MLIIENVGLDVVAARFLVSASFDHSHISEICHISRISHDSASSMNALNSCNSHTLAFIQIAFVLGNRTKKCLSNL